jgi:cytochrome b
MSANPEVAPTDVRVWDPLVRILHWTLAIAFLGAYALESPRDLHETLGWTAVVAVAVRIAWGFVGPQQARFANFVPTPAGLFGYARDVAKRREPRYIGHNPAGGAMVVALLSIVLVLGITGWMMGLDALWGADWVSELHEVAANTGIVLVLMHWFGVAWESLRHRENLVRAMVTGRKRP